MINFKYILFIPILLSIASCWTNNNKDSITKKDSIIQKTNTWEKIDSNNKKTDDIISDNIKNIENSYSNIDNKVESFEENKEKDKNLKLLSQLNIDNIKNKQECKDINFKYEKDKKKCIIQFEKKQIEKAIDIKKNFCLQLEFQESKETCFDKYYFNTATTKLSLSMCRLIKNENMNIKCKNSIQKAIQAIEKNWSKEKIEEKKQEIKERYIKKPQDCINLKNKVKCIDNFVDKDKDLRYCIDYLSGNKQNICINNSFNKVLKYNLQKAIETSDFSYCNKIWIESWVKKCKLNY